MAMVYPSLPARYDLCGLLRIGGNGLGNCLFSYFHAVVAAEAVGARIIAPTWSSVKLGPLLRGELSKRRYGHLFRPLPDEITGARKALCLLGGWPRHRHVVLRSGERPQAARRGLTVIEAKFEYSFVGLHEHRALIRERMLAMLATRRTAPPRWGAGDYAAAHIRLGDFVATQTDRLTSLTDGMRIPLAWYAGVIRRVRALFPGLPVYIFSDGRDHELADLLTIEGVQLRREPSDVEDLLAMAQARLLIGSHSTFSRWAAFLGDMPSIWLKAERPVEQPTDVNTPILFLSDDFSSLTPGALNRLPARETADA